MLFSSLESKNSISGYAFKSFEMSKLNLLNESSLFFGLTSGGGYSCGCCICSCGHR